MKENQAIVPVSLSGDKPVPRPSANNSLACRLKTRHLEASLFNGADAKIIKAVMEEVARDAR